MDAGENNQRCTCELCQTNWYMGDGGDVFQPQPAEQKTQQVDLEELHARKVAMATRLGVVNAVMN